MLTPVNTTICPAGGWSVTIEGAGPKIVADHFEVFIGQIATRLRANGMDVHNWKAKAIDLMCQQRPDIPCENKEVPTRHMTGDDVLRFLKTMWKSMENGVKPVSEELQSQRIDTCLACPKLGFISCYIGCATITEAVAGLMVGRDRVKMFPKIHKMACTACGCTASIKTMWPLDILRAVDGEAQTQPEYDKNCWVLTENQSPNIDIDAPSSDQPDPASTAV